MMLLDQNQFITLYTFLFSFHVSQVSSAYPLRGTRRIRVLL